MKLRINNIQSYPCVLVISCHKDFDQNQVHLGPCETAVSNYKENKESTALIIIYNLQAKRITTIKDKFISY